MIDIHKYMYTYINDTIFMMEMMTGKSKQTLDRHHFQVILSVLVRSRLAEMWTLVASRRCTSISKAQPGEKHPATSRFPQIPWHFLELHN